MKPMFLIHCGTFLCSYEMPKNIHCNRFIFIVIKAYITFNTNNINNDDADDSINTKNQQDALNLCYWC